MQHHKKRISLLWRLISLCALLVACDDDGSADTPADMALVDMGLMHEADADESGGADATADPPDAAGDTPPSVEAISRFTGGVHGLTVAPDGALYWADSFNVVDPVSRIYRLDPPYTGASVPTEITGELLGGLLWLDGDLYVCDTRTGQVGRYDDQLTLQSTWQARSPWNLAAGPTGDLYSVSFDGALQRLEHNGQVTTLFEGLDAPFDLAVAPDGTFWISEQGTQQGAPGAVQRWDETGQALEQLNWPWANPEGLSFDVEGDLWIAETERGELLRWTPGTEAIEVIRDGLALPIVLTEHPEGGLMMNTGGMANSGPEIWRISR